MAPLPDNLTDRYFVDYETSAGEHTVLFRYLSGTDQAAAILDLRAVISALLPRMFNTTQFLGLRFSATGSNVSNPLPFAGLVGGLPVGGPVQEGPKFISFIGRSATGRRSRLFFYGTDYFPAADYRILVPNDAALTDAFNILSTPGTSRCAPDGSTPVIWKSYVNVGYNSYIERRQRRQFSVNP